MFESVVGGVSTRVNSDWAGVIRMLEGLVFPVGLAMIVLSGTELLTSDMMFFFLAALKGKIPWWSVPYSVRNTIPARILASVAKDRRNAVPRRLFRESVRLALLRRYSGQVRCARQLRVHSYIYHRRRAYASSQSRMAQSALQRYRMQHYGVSVLRRLT